MEVRTVKTTDPTKRAVLLCGVLVFSWLAWPSQAAGDDDDEEFGCTLNLPQIIEAGLDAALLEACTRHDLCWRVQGTCGGWFPGLAHKAACDVVFYGDLRTVCSLTGAFLSLDGESEDDVEEFLDDCYDAAAAVYAGVSAAVLLYAQNQCLLCNAPMCDLADMNLNPNCCPPIHAHCRRTPRL